MIFKIVKWFSVMAVLLAAIIGGLVWQLLPPKLKVPAQQDLIITDVAILNPGKSFEQHRTIVVRDGRLAEIRPVAPGDPDPICPDCVVMPGLIDAHVHTPPKVAIGNQELFSLLYLAHGVTSIRDTGASDGSIFSLKKKLNSGKLVGPRMFACGPVLEGDPPFWPMGEVMRTAQDATAMVRSLSGLGADCIKVYNAFGLEAYEAVERESAVLNIPVIGHVPHGVGIRRAHDFEVQHVTGIPYAHGRPTPADGSDWLDVDLNAVTDGELANVIALSLSRNLSYTPTLINASRRLTATDPERWPPTHVSMELPDFWSSFWSFGVGHPKGNEAVAARLEAIQKLRDIVRAIHEGGIDILAGTDTLMPFVAPGEALIDEIRELSISLGDRESALAAATSTNGRHMGAGEVGEIRVGARADLLLMRGDPRDDLEFLTEFEIVIVDGRPYQKELLEAWRVEYREHFHGALYSTVLSAVIKWVSDDFAAN